MLSLIVKMLDDLHKRLQIAAARRQRTLFHRLYKRFRQLVDIDKEFCLRSPRHYLRKHHFPPVSFWKHARGLPSDVADDAYMSFLGFPRFAFDMMAE